MLGVIVNKEYRNTYEGYIPAGLRAWRERARRAKRRAGYIEICSGCGSTENIQVHHKDKDETNNEESNLVYLCKRCHKKKHRNMNL